MTYEQAAETATRATLITSISTTVTGFTLNEWAMVVGIVATIFTLLMNWYYKERADNRSEHLAQRHYDDMGES